MSAQRLSTALPALALLTLLLWGCTATRKDPPPGDPLLQEHMLRVQQAGVALGMAADEGDAHKVSNLARLMTTQFMATRGMKPTREEPLTPLEAKRYGQLQEEAIQDLDLLVRAAQSNNFTAIAALYNDLRTRCTNCHRGFVDRPVVVAMPVLENF